MRERQKQVHKSGRRAAAKGSRAVHRLHKSGRRAAAKGVTCKMTGRCIFYREKNFSLIVDVLGSCIKGLFLYTVLLWIDFRRYQNGDGDFTPGFDLWIVPVTAVVVIAVRKFRAKNESRNYAARYKSNESFKWGVYMGLVLIAHSVTSQPRDEAIPISQEVCVNYMVGAFIAYLVLVVMLRYAFLQYDYYRQRAGVKQEVFQRLRRINAVVAVVVTILILTAMYFSSETIVKAIMWVLEHVIGYGIAGFFFGLSKIEVKQILGMDVATPDYEAQLMVMEKYREAENGSGGIILESIILVGLAAVAVLGLFKLYKNRGANYTIGQETAEYIGKKEKMAEVPKIEKRKEREQFGNSNREKIRKLYYKKMNSRIRKDELEEVRVKTTEELRNRYEKKQDGTNLEVMTKYYQKARYSNAKCSDEDVQKVTSLR